RWRKRVMGLSTTGPEAEEWARGKQRKSPAGKKRKPRRSGAKVGIQSVASRSPSPRPFLATPICRFQSSYGRQNKIIIYWPEGRWHLWVEFRTADGRVASRNA